MLLMRIRSQLILMAAAVLLPVVVAAALALEKVRIGERDAALRGLRETVRATALIVDREAQGSLSSLKALGNSAYLNDGNFQAFYDQASALDQKPDVWTLLFNANGQQVLNTIVPFGTPPPPAAGQERVRSVLATGQPLVTDLFVGSVTGKNLTVMYTPAKALDGRSYVVANAFSVEHWTKTVLMEKLPPDWIVAVIDRQGRFIARSHKSAELLGQLARPELVSAAAASTEGLIRHSTLEGVEAYDAFAHSSLTGWTIAVAAPVKSIEAAASRGIQLALVGMALAVAAAVFAAAAFGQRFIRALEAASRAAVALGRGERPRVVKTGIREINELNQSLVDAGGLLDIERESRRHAEAERTRLLANETAARETAQAQNEAKDQFLAMLGHELRNPLAAISGATALLGRDAIDAHRVTNCVDIIRRQSRHLTHIVNDLLDVSRLMAGKIELELQPLDISASMASCVEALRSTDSARGHLITLDARPVWVNGDVVRLEQIFNNLITNALKFSPPGGKVMVGVRQDAGMAVITVEDQGIGMPPELLVRVFEPFVQGPPPANRLQSGLGIGLALVKQLGELHGGHVSATSPGVGMGSIFTFCMPSISAVPGAPVPESSLAAPAGVKLLYVEDNEDARHATGALLREFGYQVVEVVDGAGVMPAVLADKPALVLLDIGLPDMSGYEVARQLREHAGSENVCLIALTGYGQIRDKEMAALAGFDAHLIKPVDPDELVRTIEGVLLRQRQQANGDSPPAGTT